MVATHFRTDDPLRWGTGIGRNLSAVEFDEITYAFKLAIEALQNDRPQPNDIASITTTQTMMTITLDDGTEFVVPVPVLAFSWRGEWVADTVYDILDVFTVQLQGLFLTRILHTSAATFDANLLIDGLPVYQKLLGVGPIAPANYTAPVTGDTIISAAFDRRHIIDPAGTIAALTVILPPAPDDGDDFEILTSQAIAALTVTAPGTETVIGSGGALPANGRALWVYRADNATWYAELGGGGGASADIPAYTVPLTGDTIAAAPGERLHILNPAGPLATLNVNFPPGPSDGDRFEIRSSQPIDDVECSPNGADASTIWGASVRLRENGASSWVYHAVNDSWYADNEAGAPITVSGTATLDGSNPTSVPHGLNTCTAGFVQLIGSAAPGTGTTLLTLTHSGSNLNVYAWKPTSNTDPTLVASAGTETFYWMAIGAPL